MNLPHGKFAAKTKGSGTSNRARWSDRVIMRRNRCMHMPWVGKFALLIAVLLLLAPIVRATETDQFTVPPQALKDLGPDLDREVVDELQRIADKTNAHFKELIDDAAATRLSWIRGQKLAEAAECVTDSYIAKRAYEAFGR